MVKTVTVAQVVMTDMVPVEVVAIAISAVKPIGVHRAVETLGD